MLLKWHLRAYSTHTHTFDNGQNVCAILCIWKNSFLPFYDLAILVLLLLLVAKSLLNVSLPLASSLLYSTTFAIPLVAREHECVDAWECIPCNILLFCCFLLQLLLFSFYLETDLIGEDHTYTKFEMEGSKFIIVFLDKEFLASKHPVYHFPVCSSSREKKKSELHFRNFMFINFRSENDL